MSLATIHSETTQGLLGPSIDGTAIDEDQEEEIESYMGVLTEEGTEHHTSHPTDPQAAEQDDRVFRMGQTLKKAADEVIVDSTRHDYERAFIGFTEFLWRHNFLPATSMVESLFPYLPEEMPQWIALWIMSRADSVDIHTGKPLHPDEPRLSYGGAQKLRAAVTHKFGRDFGCGTAPWTENPLVRGQFAGNPSISPLVSQYMISLRRRKARSGAVVTSARAMDEETMKKLYEFNCRVPQGDKSFMATSDGKSSSWAGYRVRMMLHCLYVVSMLCLLRYDEALNIRWEDVVFGKTPSGLLYVRISLLVRKTHQNGDIAPFILYLNVDHPHLCAVTALARWWGLCGTMGMQRYGFVFRRRHGYDRLAYDAGDKMSSDAFLVCFRNNLCDVNINPRMYGTHSFRRGGCQYLHIVLRWPIRDICAWGGWAEKFDNAGTIFKYLLSWTDASLIERGDFFNPERRGTDPCNACGRTCHCA
ncbi:hypothetical protein BDW22DRAFT_11007 [Trametopsis cervina]|nr:hypothetical protein BDW22DRAFT_11007 [Trametopsis cervina]